jgi:hypothetical protein
MVIKGTDVAVEITSTGNKVNASSDRFFSLFSPRRLCVQFSVKLKVSSYLARILIDLHIFVKNTSSI